MLKYSLVVLAIAALAATQLPLLMQQLTASEPSVPAIEAQKAKQPAPVPISASAGAVTLQADRQGHYNGTFRINGKPVEGLIDTGATSVVFNESTARRLGFTANNLDFRYIVNTANGETRAASVILDRIEIGNIRVHDVRAMVLKDTSLSSTLIGMTFLRKLSSYSVRNGALQLVR